MQTISGRKFARDENCHLTTFSPKNRPSVRSNDNRFSEKSLKKSSDINLEDWLKIRLEGGKDNFDLGAISVKCTAKLPDCNNPLELYFEMLIFCVD